MAAARRFGRFGDTWVVDRTLFEHAAGGQCACCSLSAHSLSLSSLIADCTDLESDADERAQRSPWPEPAREALWTARVALRTALKVRMPRYERFVADSLPAFRAWWAAQGEAERAQVFQAPVAELEASLASMDIEGLYAVLMATLAEQVRNFEATGFPPDAADPDGSPEGRFEAALRVERGAWVVAPEYAASDELFADAVASLAGPKLLAKASSASATADSDFRGDRRLLRLMVLRDFAERAMARFSRAQAS